MVYEFYLKSEKQFDMTMFLAPIFARAFFK